MTLPLQPPLKPMLGRLARELPVDGYLYEPKWDGFRCLAFRDGDDVDLRSRHGKPLSRYFPELVQALRAVEASAFVLDGEIIVVSERGFDFPALMAIRRPLASPAFGTRRRERSSRSTSLQAATTTSASARSRSAASGSRPCSMTSRRRFI